MHNDPGRWPAARRPSYLPGGWLVGWSLSTGFCVSVGWPVTSPGFDDMPGSLAGALPLPVVEPVSGAVVLGAAGCCALPLLVVESAGGFMLSDGLAVSAGAFRLPLESEGAGAATLPLVLPALVSGVAGVVVRVRCMLLDSLLLRPWPLWWWCFLCLMTVVSVELSLGAAVVALSLAMPSLGAAGAAAEVGLSLGAVVGGRAVALPLWLFVVAAVPLSSPVVFGAAGFVVVLVPVVLVVCARAPNAERARASELMVMIFT